MNNFFKKTKNFLKIDEALSDKRNHNIDALKGFTILLVLLGHSIQIHDANFDNNLIFRIIYSFHMPMFMFLSGFILLTQLGYTFPGYFKKNAVRLVLPFLVWYLISYFIHGFYKNINPAFYFFGLMKSPDRGLWFLWILFLNSTLLFGVLRFVRYKDWHRWENYFVIGAILLSRTASTDFLGLAEVKQYFSYYAAGFFVCKYLDVLKAKRKIIFAAAIVSFPILVLSWKRNEFPTFYPAMVQWLNGQKIARLIVSIYKYAISFAGIAFSSFILTCLKGTRLYWFLCWLGTLTFDIYVCHGYFLLGAGRGTVRYLSAAFAALFLSLALTFLIMKRFKITNLLLLGQKWGIK